MNPVNHPVLPVSAKLAPLFVRADARGTALDRDGRRWTIYARRMPDEEAKRQYEWGVLRGAGDLLGVSTRIRIPENAVVLKSGRSSSERCALYRARRFVREHGSNIVKDDLGQLLAVFVTLFHSFQVRHVAVLGALAG